MVRVHSGMMDMVDINIGVFVWIFASHLLIKPKLRKNYILLYLMMRAIM
jgi:hypothetical protein